MSGKPRQCAPYGVLSSGRPSASPARASDAFNAYASHSDYSSLMPEAVPPNAQASSSNAGESTSSATARSSSSGASSTPRATRTLSRPASSLLIRSYKQANGLKHHGTHGSCNCLWWPHACGVGDCPRLLCHYTDSGDHGTIGLALLASGQPECLQHKSHNQSQSQSQPRTPTTPTPPSFTQQQQWQFPPSYQNAMASPPAYSYTYQPGQYAMDAK
ncbi:hypothetical protein L227DRAFT_611282 [Lentinus tigrinus ALCF2SS1-6]|uniref:Uncharacterized protein n=1 Tax=Lentinus tigrinus ALCF2SS1-6 TaxID=1328759 RepID=A0A5C2S926_9APHY|nr:hypothetical protein L227DRAFT_611282 [Lentinus tigrinus ALCF2SS1-6]